MRSIYCCATYVASNNMKHLDLQAKHPIFLSDFLKISPVPNFIEIHPVGAALIRADRRMDGWMDMTKL